MKYTMKQMAAIFDVTEHTLRYYTDLGLLPCERDSGNRRMFNEELDAGNPVLERMRCEH